MARKLIYIADDEQRIRDIIKSFLEKEGFGVISFYDGDSVLTAYDKLKPDMLILDIMMPGKGGNEVCAEIRKKSMVPIIIVSARDSESDKVSSLLAGCDDYMVKPFSPLELTARVKALFRRTDIAQTQDRGKSVITAGDIDIYLEEKKVECRGRDLRFTLMELNLITYLAERKNKAVGRDELLNRIWGFSTCVDTRATDDMIKRIRKKLADGGSSLKIDTVWGYGFRVSDDGAEQVTGP